MSHCLVFFRANQPLLQHLPLNWTWVNVIDKFTDLELQETQNLKENNKSKCYYKWRNNNYNKLLKTWEEIKSSAQNDTKFPSQYTIDKLGYEILPKCRKQKG